MRNVRTLIAGVLLYAGLLLPASRGAETVFEADFTEAPPAETFSISRGGGTVAGGLLTLGKADRKCFDSAVLNIAPAKPFEITGKLRLLGFADGDHHWGFVLDDGEGGVASFGRREDGGPGGVHVRRDNRLVQKADFSGGTARVLPAGKEVPLAEIRLFIADDFAELWVDGQRQGILSVPLPPTASLRVYAYNLGLQLDDLRVVRRDKPAATERAEAVFSADFDGIAAARDADGGVIPPLSGKPFGFVPGVFGSALVMRRDASEDLVFPLRDAPGNAGTVMFWHSRQGMVHDAVHLRNKDGVNRLACLAMDFAFAADFVKTDGEKFRFIRRGSKYLMQTGDWNHYAVVWDRDGSVRVYRNGLPYTPANSWEPNVGFSAGLDCADAEFLVLPAGTRHALDELRVYNRPLPPAEVYGHYRRAAPLDVVVPNAVFPPGDDAAALKLVFAPGGFYTRPAHGDAPTLAAEGEITLELRALSGVDGEAALVTHTAALRVGDAPVAVDFPVGQREAGEYAVRWTLRRPDGGRVAKNIVVECLGFPEPGAPAIAGDFVTGERVFHRRFDRADDPALLREGELSLKKLGGEAYVEIGSRKGNRLALPVAFPEKYRQKPLVFEIVWPDDAARMMGLYAYLENKKSESYRDRLQGGVQAGREIPNSGNMERARYLFWPQTPTALFEIRTLADDFPAAIAELNVYAVEGGRLPALAVNPPPGLEPRRLGHADEDQTLSTNMAANTLEALTRRILDYLDYTGQNTFHYPIARYYYSFFPHPGNNGNEFYPYVPGGVEHMVEAFARRGKRFVGVFDLTTVPEVYYAPSLRERPDRRGLAALGKDRNALSNHDGGSHAPNVAHPEVRRAFARYVEDFADVIRNPGFYGLSLRHTLGWNSLDEGYDDYTVGRFAEDEGVVVPDKGRYAFLTAPDMLPRWSRWRARQIFLLVKETRETLDRIDPRVKLFVPERQKADWSDALDEMLPALANVYPGAFRRPTNYRHDFHWGRPETNREEELYDRQRARRVFGRAGAAGGELSTLFYIYYETFTKTLDRANYGCYFQSADVKPHGRQFLKELAFNVAEGDVREIAFGGQPFGSFGREAETREFARAFTALPHLPFRDAGGSDGRAAVRYLPTKNGTYFYLVNPLWDTTEVTLAFDGDAPVAYRDLSTGERGTGLVFTLKPYALRSFLVPGRDAAVTGVKTAFSEKAAAFYRARLAELRAAFDTLRARGVELPEETATLDKIEAAFARGDLPEVHRLAFARAMNQLLVQHGMADSVARRAGMIGSGIFAVNCGSDRFVETADGRLFFPDRPFDDAGKYGYFGKHKSVARNIEKMGAHPLAPLFAAEAYDIDGYRFRLPNGRFRLTLHLKVGYPDDFRAGNVRFTVYAQGKPLFDKLDLFEAGNGDFGRPVEMSFEDIEVTDGTLTLAFEAPEGRPANHRLANAIEIRPMP